MTNVAAWIDQVNNYTSEDEDEVKHYNDQYRNLIMPHEWKGPRPPFRDLDEVKQTMANVYWIRCERYFKAVDLDVAVRSSGRVRDQIVREFGLCRSPSGRGIDLSRFDIFTVGSLVAYWEVGGIPAHRSHLTADVMMRFAKLYRLSNYMKCERPSRGFGRLLLHYIKLELPLPSDYIKTIHKKISRHGDPVGVTEVFLQSLIRRFPVGSPNHPLLKAASESHDFAMSLLESMFGKRQNTRNPHDGSLVRRFVQMECTQCDYVLSVEANTRFAHWDVSMLPLLESAYMHMACTQCFWPLIRSMDGVFIDPIS
ncbi:hypothetical protein IWX49DRAFT_550467 [Phyllosticta citricarpa]|uniref:Uncharacterized protein n=1 Tax=Phyllosticta citricarpa TaxID=55181 RepID=A0ABR1MLV8_9PEZI